jgi:hypothetical protein
MQHIPGQKPRFRTSDRFLIEHSKVPDEFIAILTESPERSFEMVTFRITSPRSKTRFLPECNHFDVKVTFSEMRGRH